MLRNLELFNAFLLPYVLVYLLGQTGVSTWILAGYALFLVAFILVQGTLYWHLKAQTIEHNRAFPAFFQPLFLGFHGLNRALLILFPLLVIGTWLAGYTAPIEIIWASGLWLFAALEHINYYHYQLMHDTLNDLAYLRRHKKLRRARLAKDLVKASLIG